MKYILVILTLMFSSTTAMTQTVISIGILPQNPNLQDTTSIVTQTFFSSNASVLKQEIETVNDTIYLNRCFLLGPLGQPSTQYDTVAIGVLPTGTYQIMYLVKIPIDDSCANSTITDSAYHSFTVAGATSIDPNEQNNTLCTLFPNPATNQHTLKIAGALQKMVTIDLYDIHGRFIRRVFNENAKQSILDLHLDIKDLITGMYVYSVKINDKKMHLKFVKQ